MERIIITIILVNVEITIIQTIISLDWKHENIWKNVFEISA